jgi:hypothetical protein
MHVAVFLVNAVDNGGGSTEFSGFKADADTLLLFLYFAADT